MTIAFSRLIKRAAIIGRLYYHTAQCLLAQVNPYEPPHSEGARAQQLLHARQVCGIVAHTKDKGVASVAIRSLAIASACLSDNDEREEVLAILDRVHRETGWRLGKVHLELKKAWGWTEAANGGGPSAGALTAAAAPGTVMGGTASTVSGLSSVTAAVSMPQQYGTGMQQPLVGMQPTGTDASAAAAAAVAGIMSMPAPPTAVPQQQQQAQLPFKVNPLYASADFSLPNHPYQNWYEPPNPNRVHTGEQHHSGC